MTRARHEASIRRLDTTFGNEFDRALTRVMARYRGLNWLTDDQVAEVRAEMVQTEWDRMRRLKANRRRAA